MAKINSDMELVLALYEGEEEIGLDEASTPRVHKIKSLSAAKWQLVLNFLLPEKARTAQGAPHIHGEASRPDYTASSILLGAETALWTKSMVERNGVRFLEIMRDDYDYLPEGGALKKHQKAAKL